MSKPNWNRDELILALDLYFREPSARGSKTHSEILELSQVLNRLPRAVGDDIDGNFRNPNGVGMKLSNFLRFDPSYEGEGLKRGGRLDGEVWAEFASQRERLEKVAVAIRANLGSAEAAQPGIDELDDDEAVEGRVLTRVHRRRERSAKLVRKKKGQMLREHGSLACEACGFDYSSRYGDLGRGFAECHHTKPVSSLEPGQKTRLTDLVVLCANCHRMIHRSKPWLSLTELKNLLT